MQCYGITSWIWHESSASGYYNQTEDHIVEKKMKCVPQDKAQITNLLPSYILEPLNILWGSPMSQKKISWLKSNVPAFRSAKLNKWISDVKPNSHLVSFVEHFSVDHYIKNT